MHATIRRYDGVDQNRITECRKVNENLVPKLRTLPGFKGYYLIEAGNGVFSSLGLFETSEQGEESSKLVGSWIHDEKLETLMPNEPKITSGKVIAQSNELANAGVTRTHPPKRGRLARPLCTLGCVNSPSYPGRSGDAGCWSGGSSRRWWLSTIVWATSTSLWPSCCETTDSVR